MSITNHKILNPKLSFGTEIPFSSQPARSRIYARDTKNTCLAYETHMFLMKIVLHNMQPSTMYFKWYFEKVASEQNFETQFFAKWHRTPCGVNNVQSLFRFYV
uniref:Uncharacterized protein n=1 Tax=Cacopsylla melanoneura TaxID=428564 RepID=A0A8D8XIT9_9HEMI